MSPTDYLFHSKADTLNVHHAAYQHIGAQKTPEKTSAVSGLIFVHCRMINLIPFSDGECAKYAKYANFSWVPDFGNFIYGIPKVRHPVPDIFTQFPKSGTQCRRWVPGAGCRTSGTPQVNTIFQCTTSAPYQNVPNLKNLRFLTGVCTAYTIPLVGFVAGPSLRNETKVVFV